MKIKYLLLVLLFGCSGPGWWDYGLKKSQVKEKTQKCLDMDGSPEYSYNYAGDITQVVCKL